MNETIRGGFGKTGRKNKDRDGMYDVTIGGEVFLSGASEELAQKVFQKCLETQALLPLAKQQTVAIVVNNILPFVKP